MNKRAEIFRMSIASLELTITEQNKLVQLIEESKLPPRTEMNWEEFDKNKKRLAKTYTVYDTIVNINPRRRNLHQFKDKLVWLGLTQLDWIELPNSTVSLESLKQLGKKRLLEISPETLGTITPNAMWHLQRHDLIDGEPTIGKLLNVSIWKWDRNMRKKVSTSILNTRKKLLDLGFTYDDGLLLQEDSLKWYIEKIMKEENLSRTKATWFAKLAVKRKYIFPID